MAGNATTIAIAIVRGRLTLIRFLGNGCRAVRPAHLSDDRPATTVTALYHPAHFEPSESNDPEFSPDFLEHFYGKLQIVAGMRCRNLTSDPRLAMRNNREADTGD